MLIGIDGNEANVTERVGSNVYAFELIKAIEKLDKKNEYTIYLREKKKPDLPQKREKLSYRVLPPKHLWTQWRLPLDLYLHQPRPQVFFTPGHYAPRFSPTPTIISILDLSFFKFPHSFKPAVLNQLKRWTKYSAKNAAHILTISESTKKDIVKYYNIPTSKITVAYPGVNDIFKKDVLEKDITAVKDKYKINKQYIFTLGTLQPKKNLPRLIQALSQFNSPNLSLVITGKTWQQFRGSEISNQLSEKIITTGFVPNEDLPALMKGAEAFVLPSLYEGFGIPVAEAMTVGTPVVVSNSTSLPEIVGEAGILIDPEDVSSIARGIKQVLALSSEKKVQLVTRAKKRAETFSWRSCAQKTLEVLYEVSV